MDIFSIFIWAIVVIMFVVMIIVILAGGNAWVYIFDEHNRVIKRRGRVKNDNTVSFKYNAGTKGGVAIEGNKYLQAKKRAFFYRDVGGILLPITDKRITEKVSSLDLSTAQEKWYETKALENTANKIDNTWWSAIKPFVMGFMILLVAMVVSIVMIQKALDVEPIPEPQLQMWQDTNANILKLVESNEKLVSTISTQQKKVEDTTPR